MSGKIYKEFDPIPEGTGWGELLEAVEKKLDLAEQAPTAERQRREKCEAAMQAAAYLIDRLQTSLAGKPVRDLDEAFEAYSNRTNEAVLAISRYPTASDSEERGG